MVRRIFSRDHLVVVAVFIFFVGLWQLVVTVTGVRSVFLPPPAEVWDSLVDGLSEPLNSRNGYWLHSGYTLAEAMGGFVIGSVTGIVFGIALAESRFLDVALRPYIVAFQSLPKVAVAPLVVVWLGFGMSSKIVITALLTFFPLVINTYTGLKIADASRLDLMRSMAATRWQTFRKVSFPGALPYVFAGLGMAVVFALVGAIVGEFVGAQRGLGVLILQRNFSLDVAGVFAVFIVMSVIGVAL
ncbi:MAG TPA: ABC transporter permease, partial [Thermomicrobiales bacterium]|nr:ABC transporter permease [Thermomicrobiales bacterium]